ncbi:MAG: 1,4-alpha-glucan branching protein GlgB [Chloroflexi bacterium]|nr:1,4-alpha-glucan branching protein GlgB [Chloroflexota bacterium]
MSALPPEPEIAALLHGQHGAPAAVFGPHPYGEASTVVRVLLPGAVAVRLVADGCPVGEFERVRPEGFFQLVVSGCSLRRYQLEVHEGDGSRRLIEDPYRFPSLLSELDIYLFNEGTHRRAYEHLGAHPRVVDGVAGVHFVVWAPNARRVSVIGDFNRWNPIAHPMQHVGQSGLWELFLPGIAVGERYKYSILPRDTPWSLEKADPYAFWSEVRPRTASIVYDLRGYEWHDAAWMAARSRRQALDAPLAIYEVHLGSWRRRADGTFLSYRELAHLLVEHVKRLGYTHVELLPIAEHPLDASWGYQVTGYYAPTSRFGTPHDFMYFVDYLHQHGIGVILDWVPGHFPRDGHGLAWFDGTHLYEHADPRRGEHPDWGTLIFNYGRNEVRSFLLSNAVYWLREYHLDGLRVDAVASMLYLDYSRKAGEWVPNQYGGRENLEAIAFLKMFNEVVHGEFPGAITVAEESTAWPLVSRPTYAGGLGFTYKWNMGWMHDTLQYFRRDPIYRSFHQGELTFSLIYAFSENFVLPLSHDEVVHGKGSLIGKMPGDWWQQFANLRLLYGFQYGHPGKKLLFMGGELGQWNEWSEATELDWGLREWPMHRGLMRYVEDLNRLLIREPALHEVDFDWTGFEWVDFHDAAQSVLSFLRKAKDPDDWLLFVFNLTPLPRHNYRIGVPSPGYYRELLNSDSEVYGGSNVGNLGGVQAEPVPAHGRPWSLRLTLPPLAVIVMKPL